MLTIGALCVGASLSAAPSAGASTSTLRAQVDSIGVQYLTAQENARALDTELRALDPVHETPIGPWMLFRYDDVARVPDCCAAAITGLTVACG